MRSAKKSTLKRIFLSIGICCFFFLLKEEAAINRSLQINDEADDYVYEDDDDLTRMLSPPLSSSYVWRYGINDIQDSVFNGFLNCKASTVKLTSLEKLKGQTIYMFGDSTMIQQKQKLCSLINEPLENIEKWEENTPFEIYPSKSKRLTRLYGLCENENVRVAYSKRNNMDFRNPNYLHELYTELAEYDKKTNQEHRTAPDVIYFNGGIHMLYIPMSDRSPALFENLYSWRNVEAYAHRFVKEAASILAPGGRIVFMSSHFIDDSKRHKKIFSSLQEWYENPKKFAKPCIDRLEEKKDILKLQEYNITDVCIEAAQTSHGVKSLDDRVKGAVAAAADELGIEVGCVDGYEHTYGRVDDTEDGMHYIPITRFELASLVDAVG